MRQTAKTGMYSIGLTGGIGSGKSRVAALLAQWGATIIDTDEIAHALTAPRGAAISPLREAFGDGAITPEGALDRAWMRDLVFRDPGARARLESILHPLIRRESQRQGKLARGPYRVFVVPLLVESGRWRDGLDRVCVVDCDPDTQVARVQARSGLTPDSIRAIMAAQSSREARLQAADDVILNDGATTPDMLTARTKQMHDRWIALAAAQQGTGRQASAW